MKWEKKGRETTYVHNLIIKPASKSKPVFQALCFLVMVLTVNISVIVYIINALNHRFTNLYSI